MNRDFYEKLKMAVEYGDVYYVDETGTVRNVRAVVVDRDGDVYLASDPADLLERAQSR
ncbi:MAG: hypothetical protein IJE97_09005 [Thermoguttaceae bacterium]|nr:hypothetical protein [Thermoguttaceae bacterium]MBR2004800.1 hypothetical protein [Thermoguttaceae bacterium]MBR4104138.1 hypothetical protein [Thermoguttaceae bacterium]